MKILLLTPGTGNFHCGSCLHDEALLRGLRRLGHDAAIHALYLPLVLDDREGIDGDAVSMGGIGLYLQAKSALLRQLPAAALRWLDRPGLLRRAANRADMTSPSELGRMTEEMLLGANGKTRVEVARLVEHLEREGRPDVVLLNNALLLGLAEPIARALDCPVVCTLQGEDTFIDSLPDPWRSNTWQLLADKAKDTALFLPVSAHHSAIMGERMGLAPDRMRIVYNGIEAAHYPPQTEAPDPPVIGYLARLCAAKGLDTLVDAYIEMQRRSPESTAELHLIGAATPNDLRFVEAQRVKLRREGLIDRVTIRTNVTLEEKTEALRGMSVLSVPAMYGESFGLYVLEANAVGVPAVEPNHAGLAEVIRQTGGGILYEPGERHFTALAEALTSLLGDAAERRRLGEAGRAVVLDRFTAERMARDVAQALESACPAFTA
ncbi:MAG: glycosyltransferase family 4 protein [Phycisphaeraceae bacterium]